MVTILIIVSQLNIIDCPLLSALIFSLLFSLFPTCQYIKGHAIFFSVFLFADGVFIGSKKNCIYLVCQAARRKTDLVFFINNGFYYDVKWRIDTMHTELPWHAVNVDIEKIALVRFICRFAKAGYYSEDILSRVCW